MPERGTAIPRLVPDEPFPACAYVPGGKSPHPARSAAGRSAVNSDSVPPPLDPNHWRKCRMYLRGIDFFNHGYYWEAHEAWENLWHAAGRRGPVAEFLKGLIALAAAGVKAREGRAAGVKQHARRAGSIFDAIKVQTLADEKTDFMGMNLSALIDAAIKLAAAPEKALNMADRAVVIVFEFQLSLWVGPPGVHQASE